MTINTDFRVAVINKSGNIGKTTVSRVLLKMRMPNAELISIEDLNADGQEDKNGQMVQASKFKQVYQALMYSPSVILDIGSSNLKETMQLMRQSEGSHDEIDYFLVPVVEDIKQIRDSVKTVHELLKLGVEAEKIKVIFNKVGLTESVEDVFAEIIHALKKLGVPYDTDIVIYKSDFFPAFDSTNMSIQDFKDKFMTISLADNKKRMNELRRNRNRTELEDSEFKEIMSIIHTQQLAIKATRDLDAVFKAIFKEEIIDDEPVANEVITNESAQLKDAIEKLDGKKVKAKS